MYYDEMDERNAREIREHREAQAAYRAQRKLFLEKLLGGSDPLTWQMPTEIDDFDALLAQHAAQLRNAVRYMMGEALSDDASAEQRIGAAGALTRMIQTNIAIARKLLPKDAREMSKTGHGGEQPRGTQD